MRVGDAEQKSADKQYVHVKADLLSARAQHRATRYMEPRMPMHL